MNRRSIKAKLIIFVAMTVAIGALTLPVCAFGFCDGCTQQCADEAEGVYIDCMHGTTKPMEQCAQERDNYKAMCNSIFCPGCPINH